MLLICADAYQQRLLQPGAAAAGQTQELQVIRVRPYTPTLPV
jgi:hypothetical protein